MPFFIIFLLIPFIEIAVFIWVGGQIGIGVTLLLTFLTAVIGGLIIKYQGLFTVSTMRDTLTRGALPVKEIFDGFCLVTAGAMLITPGFVTDIIGFTLLVPPVRDAIRDRIAQSRHFQFKAGSHDGTDHRSNTPPPGVIEGEYERVEDEEPRS